MAQVKKRKKSEDKIPKGLEPKRSIFANPIVKVVIFSVIGAIAVYFLSQIVSDLQESESIAEIRSGRS